MAKWGWLIVDEDGSVTGTDDADLVQKLLECEQYVIINPESCSIWTKDEENILSISPIPATKSTPPDRFEGEEQDV